MSTTALVVAGIIALAVLVALLRCERKDIPKIIGYISPWGYRRPRQ